MSADALDVAAGLQAGECAAAVVAHALRPRHEVRHVCLDCGGVIPTARVAAGIAGGDPVVRCVVCQQAAEVRR